MSWDMAEFNSFENYCPQKQKVTIFEGCQLLQLSKEAF